MGENTKKAELFGVREDGSMVKLEDIDNMTIIGTQNPVPYVTTTASTGNDDFVCDGDCDACQFGEACEEGIELNLENIEEQIEACDDYYYGILDEARIGPWKKTSTGEEGMLYCFTSDVDAEIELNRGYLKDLLKAVVQAYDELVEEYMNSMFIPEVDRILRSGDATIVFWKDGTKTVVKRASDEADSDYIAFTAALGKKIYGSNSKLSRFIKSKIEYQKPKEKKPEASEEAKKAFSDMLWSSQTYTRTDNSHNPEEHVDAYN